jgi:CubicO group peptidase (beta-lactamase class C family)
MRFLADRLRSKRRVEQVELGFDGRWVAVAGQEPAFEGISDQLADRLRSSARDEVHVSKLMLGPDDSYVLYSHGPALPGAGNTIEAIEYGTPGGDNLWERMSAAGMPGLAIAVIEDNQVKYARGYGVLRQGGDAHVLASTPFDMASLSKFIGALTMMKLDTDTRYDFDVDDSVTGSARSGGLIADWLDKGSRWGWFYGMPNVDVSSALSVAHFMRHQSDFVKSGGSPGFKAGSWGLSQVTTLKLLLGYDCGAICGYNGNNFAWTSGGAGPVAPSYDSVNFLVPQAVAEDVTGKAAYALAREYFFAPMGLDDISGDPASGILSRAAWPHDANGPRADRLVFPWTFAGGIMASTADYAEMMILALNQGRDSQGVQRIPASAVARMLQVQNGNVAFGLFADTKAHITESNDNRFKHSGAHGGRARTYMCGNPTRDGGIVIAFNADLADGADANSGNDTNDLRTYIVNQFMAAVGWPGDCL